MWDDRADVFQEELDPGERLLWSGRPRRGLVLRLADGLVVPLGILWGGFGIYWEISVLRGGSAPLLFQVWGIPFVLVGLYITVGRFFIDALVRRETYYALTESRIIIIMDFGGRYVQSLSLATLPELTLGRINAAGQGTINLGPARGYRSAIAGLTVPPPYRDRSMPPRLEMIEDARGVYHQIRAAQDRLANRHTPG